MHLHRALYLLVSLSQPILRLCTMLSAFDRPKLLPFDHIRPSLSLTLDPPPRTAIFYASPGSANFQSLHAYLHRLSAAKDPRLEYVFRYKPLHLSKERATKAYLSGYGVALDLKKTDYLAVDDRRASSSEGILPF